MEISPLFAHMKFIAENGPRMKKYSLGNKEIDSLTTGVGMIATASWCSHVLATNKYDLAINFGTCGSFDRSLDPGMLVHIVTDRIAELGAEDGEKFLTVNELNLLGENELPFKWGQLVNLAPPSNPVMNAIATVNGITVNKVHGNEKSISETVKRWNPHVESMEGAAFMYACMTHDTVFAQVRAVSNFIEKRNRDAWKMAEAIKNLSTTGLEILNAF